MKKTLLIGLLLIIFGFMIGNYYFSEQNNILTSIKNIESFYVLQEGVYSNKNNIKKYTSDLAQKVIDQKGNQYYVYVGITKDKQVANKIKKIYEEKGYEINIKEKSIPSEEFLTNVTQFDLLIKATNSDDEILTIEEVVLANYEEIVKKQ